ncbi:hypothetical protein RA210_U80117 [Rubrivivax sp. A210]|nr:hypothetical protein RA210_U80117 [Rubrivivax sp. A210]
MLVSKPRDPARRGAFRHAVFRAQDLKPFGYAEFRNWFLPCVDAHQLSPFSARCAGVHAGGRCFQGEGPCHESTKAMAAGADMAFVRLARACRAGWISGQPAPRRRWP